MECELCSTSGQGGSATRCPRCGFDTTLPPDVKRFLISLIGFRPGELLDGRYRIDRILGYGGMSVVYKARDEVLGEDVAIKVINRVRAGDDKLITDIRRDIVTTRKLAHPDIVKIYDFHKAETCGFLTMEFVTGKDVASLITERGRLEEGEVCRIAEQVAEALHYAHVNGVVHCDIKPGNLLLTENGRVKIADFGISRLMHEESSGLTGLVVGTPAYMAPEQIRGERPTPRTDMYALGIVMWHCLMGAPPYTKGDISYQHVHEPLPPLTGVSPDVERIVRRAASKAPDDRYPSMAVMAQELHEVLRRMALAVEATLVQSPLSGQAATLLQTPAPAPAGSVPRALSPEQAGIVVQAPPSEQVGTVRQAPTAEPVGTVAQTTPAAQAGTVRQIPPPAEAGTVARTTPPAEPGIVARTPPPESARRPERPPPPPPGGTAPSGSGGPPPPASGGPGGAKAEPPPPPPSSKKWLAAVAALVMLLGGATLWALFRPAQPGQPQLASIADLTRLQTELAKQQADLAKQQELVKQQSEQANQAELARQQAGRTKQAELARQQEILAKRAELAKQRADQAQQTELAKQQADLAQQQAELVKQQELARQQADLTRQVEVAKQQEFAKQQADLARQVELAKQQEFARQQADAARHVEAAKQQELARQQAELVKQQADQAKQAELARQQAELAKQQELARQQAELTKRQADQAQQAEEVKVATRDLGPPIQLTALPRGRWCDVQVRAVGTGLPMSSARSEAERRLTAERSAEVDAYRRIAENVRGIQVSGGSTVKDFVTTDASYKTKVEAVIRGARRVDSQKNADGTWSVVMELNLSGMCDVIQVGTP